MRSKNIFFSLIFLLSLAVMGCEEIIEVPLDESNAWVTIEGWVTDEPGPYQIQITKTIPIYSTNELFPAQTAVVTITDDLGNVDNLVMSSPGIYETTSMQGSLGRTYTLNVDYEGENYTATETLPRVNPIDTLVTIFQDETIGFLEKGYYIIFVAQEAPGRPDYYRFYFTVNDSLYDGISDLFFTDDAFTDGQLALLQFPYQLELGDTVEVKVQSIPSSAYNYYTTLQDLLFGGGSPFGAPPDNVKGNLNNGALGYFGAGGVAKKEVIVTP